MSDEKNRLTPNDVWGNSGNNDVMGEYAAKANLDASEKEGVLLTVCQGKYKEEDLIHIRVNSDLSAGWALTTDSVCFAGNWGSAIIPYEEIVEIIDGTQAFELTQHMRRIPWIFNCRDGKQIVVEGVAVGNEVSNALKRFLIAAKNMCNSAVATNEAPQQAVQQSPRTVDYIVSSPFAGMIKSVHIAVGETIRIEQLLFEIYAMKMMNEIVADCDGTVKEIKVSSGQTVSSGETLAIISKPVE